MDDAGGVCGGQAVGDADEQLDDLPPRALVGPRPVSERAAVDELRDQILPAVELPDVVDREDVRMVQRGRRLRFALEAAARGRIGQRRRTET